MILHHTSGLPGKRQATRRRADRRDLDHLWQRHLPQPWQAAVARPLHLAHYREYEMDASRTVGYDVDGKPCFVAHHFVLAAEGTRTAAEASTTAYSEDLAAWRLHDDRWLVFRITGTGAASLPQGFYAFHAEMPR